jgi:hypothetical protein
MFDKLKKFFESTWKWIQAVWDKHDEHVEEMVAALLPMVISVAFRNDLSGEEKKRAIIDAVVDNAQAEAVHISTSLLNEAVEIAANKYNIQIGKTTVDAMDAARDAAVKASRDFANKTLKIEGSEAEDAGITPAE